MNFQAGVCRSDLLLVSHPAESKHRRILPYLSLLWG